MGTWPTFGDTPWDVELKGYIDDQDSTNAASAAAAVPKSLVDAKGDLLVGTAADTVARLPVGANGRQMFADSSQATGLRWGGAGETVGSGDVLSGGDLNVATTPGVYLANGAAANAPVAATTGFLLVRRQGSTGTNIQQEFTSQSTVPRKFVRRSADGGASWAAWTEVRTDAPLAGNTIAGTGMPEGIVPAPVGTEYTDSAATNGAVEWVKASGTGNTGWRVVYGDTGWRNVPFDAAYGTGGIMRLRRLNGSIYMALGVAPTISVATTSGQKVMDIATGFRPAYNMTSLWGTTTGTISRALTISAGSINSYGGALNPGDSLNAASSSWPTTDPWPSVLPGTAA